MTVKAYNRMIRKMQHYVSKNMTFKRFRNDHVGYGIGLRKMHQAWKVAEMRVTGRIRPQEFPINTFARA